MMPFSMNYTLMNRESLHSTLIEEPTYEIISLVQDDDKEDLQKLGCIFLDFDYPAVMWPFFGQIRVKITAPDKYICRQ